MSAFHPDLEKLARRIPRFSFGLRSVRFIRFMSRFGENRTKAGAGVRVELATLPPVDGAPPVRVRVIRPEGVTGPVPALLWIHGGGMMIGTPTQDDPITTAFARALGIVVVAVKYRLAPEHPFPAPLDDCFTALKWMRDEAASLGIRADRIAVGGASAGGGLAAGVCLRARANQLNFPVFQLLVYPMIDDRTVTRTDIDDTNVRVWSRGSNRLGWTSYLNRAPGSPDVPSEAAPARNETFKGLPPAWIGVGTLDLFHDEDVGYARRLNEAGVPCALDVVPGAYHGFDVVQRDAPVVKAFFQAQVEALRGALLAP